MPEALDPRTAPARATRERLRRGRPRRRPVRLALVAVGAGAASTAARAARLLLDDVRHLVRHQREVGRLLAAAEEDVRADGERARAESISRRLGRVARRCARGPAARSDAEAAPQIALGGDRVAGSGRPDVRTPAAVSRRQRRRRVSARGAGGRRRAAASARPRAGVRRGAARARAAASARLAGLASVRRRRAQRADARRPCGTRAARPPRDARRRSAPPSVERQQRRVQDGVADLAAGQRAARGDLVEQRRRRRAWSARQVQLPDRPALARLGRAELDHHVHPALERARRCARRRWW